MDSFKQIGLEMALTVLQDNQRQFLEKLDHLNTDPDTLARYGTALQIEVSEFVNELPWKVWKQKTIKPERVVDEFADVLAFIGTWVNLLSLMGITPGLLALAYAEKTRVNQERILKGTVPGYGNPKDGYAQVSLPPEAVLEVGRPVSAKLSEDLKRTIGASGTRTGRVSIPEPNGSASPRSNGHWEGIGFTADFVSDSPPERPNLDLVDRAFPARPIPDVMDLAGGLEEDTELDPLYDSVTPLDDSDEEGDL